MLHFLKRMGVLGIYLSCLFFIACASAPEKQEFSNAANPSKEINELESNINKSFDEQVNILSPHNFSQANAHLKEAKIARVDNKSRSEVLDHVGQGNSWLLKANDSAKRLSNVIPEIVDARAKALENGSNTLSKTEWQTADNALIELAKSFEQGNFNVPVRTKEDLLAQYKNLIDSSEEVAATEGEFDSELAAMSAEPSQFADNASLDEKFKEASEQFEPGEAEVFKDVNKIVIRLKGLKFASGRADLTAESYPIMTKLQNVIKSLGNASVDVEGHTDSYGRKEMNTSLSEYRAETVKDYLVENGAIDPADITATGYGDEKPITTNNTKDGRAQNRRVDVIITPQ